jgi:mono/diheme cytochrome c family protein
MTLGARASGFWLVIAGLILVPAGSSALGEQADKGTEMGTIAGGYTFKTYCATCHGKEAKGDGPMADSLRFRPPDLTLLAKRNGGTYPAETVYRTIEGRKPVKGHGGPDMPVWGDAFKNIESGFSEQKVKERIDGLVEFLKSIQAPR